jgi:uncharacterized protein YuzE
VRIMFDSDVDALTFVLSDAPVARTVEAGDGRMIDLDDQGRVIAVEILGASSGLALHDLTDRFDLTPLFVELRESARHARAGVEGDPMLREALAAR